MVKLLLDENLSARVALDLRSEGHDVVHIRERGALGRSDQQVLDLAFEEDRVLVTANVADFQKLAGAKEIHAGVVLLFEGSLTRDEQRALLREVLIALSARADLVNQALIVERGGLMRTEDLPA